MTPQQEAAMRQALEALTLAVRQNSHDMLMTGEELRPCEQAITALTAALEQPAQQEPVAHCVVRPLLGNESIPRTRIEWRDGKPVAGPLYTRPQAREWVGLTDDERTCVYQSIPGREFGVNAVAAAIEAKLREKNA